jgi:hypothetical protein
MAARKKRLSGEAFRREARRVKAKRGKTSAQLRKEAEGKKPFELPEASQALEKMLDTLLGRRPRTKKTGAKKR